MKNVEKNNSDAQIIYAHTTFPNVHLKYLSTYSVKFKNCFYKCKFFSFGYRYLGSGCDQIDLHLSYKIGHTTIGKILRKVCNAIWECLRVESFPDFTQERWKEIAGGFKNYAHFPNCLGAIDGKHVRIKKPKKSGSL
jgi:hypothetical protein